MPLVILLSLLPSSVIPSLLLPLSCPHKIVRKEAHQCLLVLLQLATDGEGQQSAMAYSTCPLLHLLAAISTCRLELVSDRMGLRMLLERVFKSVNRSGSGMESCVHQVQSEHRVIHSIPLLWFSICSRMPEMHWWRGCAYADCDVVLTGMHNLKTFLSGFSPGFEGGTKC